MILVFAEESKGLSGISKDIVVTFNTPPSSGTIEIEVSQEIGTLTKKEESFKPEGDFVDLTFTDSSKVKGEFKLNDPTTNKEVEFTKIKWTVTND